MKASRNRTIFIVDSDPVVGEQVKALADEYGIPTRRFSTVSETLEALRKQDAAALLLGSSEEDLVSQVIRVRDEKEMSLLPLLAVVREPRSETLRKAFDHWLDDFLVLGSLDHLRGKLAVLVESDEWKAMRAPVGLAVVGVEDRQDRILWARILQRHGYDIHFASTPDEVEKAFVRMQDYRMFLVSQDLLTQNLCDELRRSGDEKGKIQPSWIFLTSEERTPAADLGAIRDVPGIALFETKQPAENITHVINKLMAPPQSEARKSPRLYFAEPVRFMIEGDSNWYWTFSWNLNRQGLFLRTLTPPPQSTRLTLEFTPPFGEGMVHLDAQVVWRKEFGSKRTVLSPTGMGVLFTRIPLADTAALEAGYQKLLSLSGEQVAVS